METKVYTKEVIRKAEPGSQIPFRMEDKPIGGMIMHDYLDYDMLDYNINKNIKDFVNNKMYTTELGGNSESVKAGEARTRAIGLLPFVKKRRISLSDENKSFNRKDWTKE